MLLVVLSVSTASGCSSCQYAGPATPDAQPAWLERFKEERSSVISAIDYRGGQFDNPFLAWTGGAFIQPQMHPYDLYFYEPSKAEYTVDRYLADLDDRYGGIDALLLWPTYTNIGIDDRNQFDYFRALPGGLDALRNVTSQLKSAGVRVLWPYNPWDTGTRREPSSDAVTLARLLKQTGGDGFNGDTMGYIPRAFWQAAVEAGYPLALEPEGGGSDESLNWSTLGWGYWNYSSTVPVVDRQKFITRGRFMTNCCDRWAKNKTDNLQAAWFNGVGYESWENVWGIWNGIVPRDAETLRRVACLLRFFGGEVRLLHSSGWEPHTREASQPLVYASRWDADADDTRSAELGLLRLWTLVNRAGRELDGVQLRVVPVSDSSRFYDCYRGVEIEAEIVIESSRSSSGELVALGFPIETEGFGCVVESSAPAGAELARLLVRMRKLTSTPLQRYSKEWVMLQQTVVPIAPTPPAAPPPSAPPEGTVYVPHNASYRFVSSGLEIEGNDGDGVDVQFPWEDKPRRDHNATVDVGPFYIDRFPVTNRRYAAYLNATGYLPDDAYNWLRHWGGASEPPARIADAPVTWVSLGEARRFCAWAGARLPRAYEWQWAAQGADGRLYPWGTDRSKPGALPAFHNGTTAPGPEVVGAHSPAGDSPFGVADCVGNVWQYTDEFRDEHTRAVVLRGGSNYRPAGSAWYFPNRIELNTHGKYFLMSDSYERAGTVGMRCVVDASRTA